MSDAVQAVLDDHIVKAMGIRGSPFAWRSAAAAAAAAASPVVVVIVVIVVIMVIAEVAVAGEGVVEELAVEELREHCTNAEAQSKVSSWD